MRAAVYLRVSTDQDSQKLSPQHQFATCADFAKQHGFELDRDAVYYDAGLTGTEMEHRSEVQRLVRDARLGKYDVVLFTAISRFARDLSDALQLKKRLETLYGIRIISIEEGYDTAVDGRNSELIFTVHAMMAAHKSHEMSTAIRRGLHQAAKAGRHIGNVPPFGYTKNGDKKLIPDPAQAPIVKTIFQLYLRGLSTMAIAKYLNEQKYPTCSKLRGRKPAEWQPSTVAAILHNEAYIGTLVANKWRVGVDIEQSRRLDSRIRRQMQRDDSDWIVLPKNHEALVDASSFATVQQMMAAKASHRGAQRSSNVLAGLMRCLGCGSTMIISTSKVRNLEYQYIGCATVRRFGRGACKNHSKFRCQEILAAVVKPLRLLSVPSHLRDQIVNTIMDALGAGGLDQRIADLTRRIHKNERTQRDLVYTLSGASLQSAIIEERLHELRVEVEALNEQVANLRQLQVHEQESAAFNRRVEIERALDVFNALDWYDSTVVRTILAMVVDTIEFTPTREVRIVYKWMPADELKSS